MDSGLTAKWLAAQDTNRALIFCAALSAAMPFRSLPDDAAVGDVLGTLSVRVDVQVIQLMSTWNSAATTCATLV